MSRSMIVCALLLAAATGNEAFAADDGGATYYWIAPDGGGGYDVARVGGAPSCHVDAVDLSQVGANDAQRAALDTWLARPYGVIVRGSLGASGLVAQELWIAGVPGSTPSGTGVRVAANEIRCIQAPCPDKDEAVLNGDDVTRIASLDFTPSGAKTDDVSLALDSLHTGLIVFGARYIVSHNGASAPARTVTQFYTRWPPMPGAPMSGEACEALGGDVDAACEPDHTIGPVVSGVCCAP
jgi:hypothetical protein